MVMVLPIAQQPRHDEQHAVNKSDNNWVKGGIGSNTKKSATLINRVPLATYSNGTYDNKANKDDNTKLLPSPLLDMLPCLSQRFSLLPAQRLYDKISRYQDAVRPKRSTKWVKH